MLGGPFLPLSAGTVVLLALPLAFKTFINHFINRKKIVLKSEARDELLFDEAFTIVKTFLAKSAEYPVEDVQSFGNTFVPAPWWVRVVRVDIPASTCADAAKYLGAAFGEDELRGVVGGEQWWQHRGHKDGGVEGEWITMKEDRKQAKARSPTEASQKARSKSRTGRGKPDKEHRAKSSGEKKASKGIKAEAKGGAEASGGIWNRAAKQDASSVSVPGEVKPTASEQSLGPLLSTGGANIASPSGIDDDDESMMGFEDLGADTRASDENMTDAAYDEGMDHMPCLLYIHGGGYYFGSINTHRYTIWRYAHKIGGRAFAVHYRLAPQYPFPCALADCLASYLYLIRPPEGAKHRPVNPSKLIIGGDSAGGGLSLALLTVIRDAGLPLPAGAVLISPWCDLTHSFPSILQNTKTDIIPPYGFMHQPSALWPPPDPMDTAFVAGRVQMRTESGDKIASAGSITKDPTKKASTNNTRQAANRPATDQPSQPIGWAEHVEKEEKRGADVGREGAKANAIQGVSSRAPVANGPGKVWRNPYILTPFGDSFVHGDGDDKGEAKEGPGGGGTTEPANIIRLKVDSKVVEIKEQIQLYATNDQITHPYCSPALAPSLGGLPPLYIMAGEQEVLRDEIVYVAHRAAHPERYPLRKGLLEAHPKRAQLAKLYPPTQVHLQIYDGACHVLPLFSFTTPAKYCYRAIAAFCKYVTSDNPSLTSPASSPGAGLSRQASSFGMPGPIQTTLAPISPGDPVESPLATPVGEARSPASPTNAMPSPRLNLEKVDGTLEPLVSADEFKRPHPQPYSPISPPPLATKWARNNSLGESPVSRSPSISSQVSSGSRLNSETRKELPYTIYHPSQPWARPPWKDSMVRERVDVRGRVRELEPEGELQGLRLRPEEIGVLKEGPVRRWLDGKRIWDKKSSSQYEKIQAIRKHNIKRSAREEAVRAKERLRKDAKLAKKRPTGGSGEAPVESSGRADEDDGWDVLGETPPPSSIAARRDTWEARKLAESLDRQSGKSGKVLRAWARLNDMQASPAFEPPQS